MVMGSSYCNCGMLIYINNDMNKILNITYGSIDPIEDNIQFSITVMIKSLQ